MQSRFERRRRFLLVPMALAACAAIAACRSHPKPTRDEILRGDYVFFSEENERSSEGIRARIRRRVFHGDDPVVMLDSAYDVLISNYTLVTNRKGNLQPRASLRPGTCIEMYANGNTSTTTTIGIPKWFVEARRIVVADEPNRDCEYEELRAADGVVVAVTAKTVTIDIPSRRPQTPYEYLVDDDTVFASTGGLAQPRTALSVGANVHLVERMADAHYLEAVRNYDFGDVPPCEDLARRRGRQGADCPFARKALKITFL